MMKEAIDPIRLSLVQNRLDHITRQMGWVMSQTALSPVFTQGHDFTCYLTDSDGYVISQAEGMPAHTAGGGFAIRAMIEAFGDDIHEGDIFLMNDPYTAGGNHLLDCTLANPVFVEGKLIAFSCNRAHQSDIGGGAPGGYKGDATEIFQEGLRIPPVRVIEKGNIRDDIWRMILLNTRMPELFDGDLRAMVGASNVAAERIVALAGEIGHDRILDYFAGIMDWADAAFRKQIASLPDGVYTGEEYSDNDCFENGRFTIRVKITVKGDRLDVDFDGTDPQMRGFKNSPFANSYSYACVGLVSFIGHDLPMNEGTFRAVTMNLPAGTLVNPVAPAPQMMSTLYLGFEVLGAIWRALAKADPDRACAGWAKSVHGLSAGRKETGEPYVMFHWQALPAGGAVRERDGFHQIGLPGSLGGMPVANVEGFERAYPIRVHRQELRCDSAGAGERRGGAGVDYDAEMFGDVAHTFRSEGLNYAGAFGVNGGLDGTNSVAMIYDDGVLVENPPQFGLRHVRNPRFILSSAGGGGWGDPKARDRQAVLNDVRDGIVSREAAARIYGVNVDANI